MSFVFRSTRTEPAARGREFGTAHARRIHVGVERYRALFRRVAQRPFDMHAMGAQALEHIARFAPPLHAEIAGMAAGADIDVRLLGAINARTEILAALGAPLRGECSTVVQVDAHSACPVAVQTWDWYAEFADQWLTWEIPHADGHVTTTVTEIGIVGKAGVNDRGIGVHFNILHHERDGATIGVPVHVVSRWMLDTCGDINRALQLLASAEVSASSSLTVIAAADNGSAAVSVELHPGGPGFVFPDADGLLVHTNHFLSSPAAAGDTEPRQYPDTLVRHDLLARRLRGRTKLSATQVVGAMNSHLGTTGAVCCHPDPSLPDTGQYATLATIVIDVAGGTLRALCGGPCNHVQLLAAA
ncbi:C45 family autoproteolytic acyltransferase/hydolase [Burkholderia pseudomultivorans]|uniref:C45 family autoproteolytic acyltransferase/hydolase n=1 Tax=Burkholderia pseudomultivorans TaxID=1207504 RepID=UPI001E59E6AA|nr:C45 family peptidase [Burkholderia pseudomultivorans]